MKLSSSYQAYRNFEQILKSHTEIILPDKKHPNRPAKIYCSRVVAEMVADKPYKIIYYNSVPIYLLIMCRKKQGSNVRNLGFAFYDEKHRFFEGKIADYLMSQPELRITELQVRRTVGLEETLKETKSNVAAKGA